MAITCLFIAICILSGHALLYYGTGSLENLLLCLVEGGLGFTLFLSLSKIRRAMWIRAAMIAVAILILWFQRVPWFGVDDSAFVRHSFMQEYLRQRLVQAGEFMLFALPFAIFGILRGNRSLKPNPKKMNVEQSSLVSLVVIPLIPILSGLVFRLMGGTPDQQVTQAIIETVIILASLYWLARRAEQADKGVIVALAVVAIGAPFVQSWR
jgi:hypothetical protein